MVYSLAWSGKTKFGSKWTKCKQNHNHQSKKEANRCNELTLLQKAGKIENLRQQPKFELQPAFRLNGKKIRNISYVADFSYWDHGEDKKVIEDTKGYGTNVYKLKKKMFLYKKRNDNIKFLES